MEQFSQLPLSLGRAQWADACESLEMRRTNAENFTVQSKMNVFGLRVVFVVENLCPISCYDRYDTLDTTQSYGTDEHQFHTEKGEPPKK